jgi:archaeosine-15-forming tRNA-guanine transglycosylase
MLKRLTTSNSDICPDDDVVVVDDDDDVSDSVADGASILDVFENAFNIRSITSKK